MNQLIQVREQTLELPASAPMVRITAGFGSAGQKTWNLRRPVTLLGCRRPAHIVLHDPEISNAHCVVVNTGTEILLKDLHSTGGTVCNSTSVNLTVLKDGDVFTIGKTNIQVAIRTTDDPSHDSGCGVKYIDPTRFPNAVTLQLDHTDMKWTIEEAAVLIGAHGDAAIRLDHPDLSKRHALLFRFCNGPAVFDLGSRTGISVNGQRCSLTPLANGDRLTLGPFGLTVGFEEGDEPALLTRPEGAGASSSASAAEAGGGRSGTQDSGAAMSNRDRSTDSLEPRPCPISDRSEPAADALQSSIAASWDNLNSWQSRVRADAFALEERQKGLAAREAELDARDAALRGQLHDVTRFHEQVLAREREIAALAARTQADADSLAAAQKAFAEQQQELERREKELTRRENILSQRWSRLTATRCSGCGQPVNFGKIDAG